MKQIITYLVIIASIMTVELRITHNETKKTKSHYHLPIFTNICNIEDRNSKVHCYCDNILPKLALRADCWIFTGGLTEDDAIWPSFSSQAHLEDLIFNARSDDALTFIPAKAIIRLDKLKYISIQFGTIRTLPPHIFTNSSTIRTIILKSNKITNLEKHSFAQMFMLSNLSLDDNLISELKRDVFYNLPNLNILHLSNNNLSLVHEGCFNQLNNLIELKLDFNYISVITREMLEGLEKLSRLNLRNNKLTMIGNLAFSESCSLKELMLDNNAIEYISERAFGGLTQLTKLTLSGNKLTSVYEDIFEDTRSLILLDLRDNLLDTVSYETIRPLVENEKTHSTDIYLDGNPLNCDCRLFWIYMIRNETKDTMLKTTLDNISCITDKTTYKINDQHIELEESHSLNEDSYEYYDKVEETNDKLNYKGKINKLANIPLTMLPCPTELKKSMEKSYGLPVQNEIKLKAFSKANKCMLNVILLLINIFF